MDGDIKCNH